jgi:hypothetical protein
MLSQIEQIFAPQSPQGFAAERTNSERHPYGAIHRLIWSLS